MDWWLTRHARERMEARGISEEDVKLAFERPDGVRHPGNRPDTVVHIGYSTHGRRLKVILDAADSDRIISVMWKDER